MTKSEMSTKEQKLEREIRALVSTLRTYEVMVTSLAENIKRNQAAKAEFEQTVELLKSKLLLLRAEVAAK